MDQSEHGASEEMVFKPAYPARVKLSIILYPVGILAILAFIFLAVVSQKPLPYLIFAFVIAFTSFSMPVILFREVRFGEEQIVLKRYFLPRRIIHYKDVIDLSQRGLVAKHGGIPLANLQNRAEFEKIIRRLVNQKKIRLMKK